MISSSASSSPLGRRGGGGGGGGGPGGARMGPGSWYPGWRNLILLFVMWGSRSMGTEVDGGSRTAPHPESTSSPPSTRLVQPPSSHLSLDSRPSRVGPASLPLQLLNPFTSTSFSSSGLRPPLKTPDRSPIHINPSLIATQPQLNTRSH